MKRGFLFTLLLFSLPITIAFCGDGKVDDGENCKACPEDNPCFIDSACIDYICVPRIVPPLFLKLNANSTIIIPKEIAESLNTQFKQETEFVSCLEGKYADGIYQITRETQPKIVENSPFHIEHAGCSRFGTIATIHSHLDGSCTPSREDLFSFGKKREPLLAIVCGENNYGFYSQENFNKKMNYLIRNIPERKNRYVLFYVPWIFSILLIVTLVIVLFGRRKALRSKNKELVLNIMEKFNMSERKILNVLIELGELPRKNIPLGIFTKLNKENIIEIKGTRIKIKEWFRDILKGL